MAETHDPIAFELFKNAIFSVADEMALTIFRTTYSAVLKDNMDYSTGFADGDGRLELDIDQRALNPVQPVYWKIKEWK